MSQNDQDNVTAASTDSGLSGPLATDALLSLQGPDAAKFLQGQTTANFNGIQPLDVRCGAFCDVKGRVIADFLALVVNQEAILLRVAADLAEALVQHLGKYLMFSKAELQAQTVHPWGIIGANSLGMLGISETVDASRAVDTGDGWLVGLSAQFALWLPQPESTGAPNALQPTETETLINSWHLGMIERGDARVTASTSGRYLPQDLSYDLAGWVSFDKGCYTGQEIIARLHWRGTAKRRLYRGTVGTEQPKSGATLWRPGETRGIGSIVTVATTPTGSEVLLETTSDNAGNVLVVAETTHEVAVDPEPVFVEPADS